MKMKGAIGVVGLCVASVACAADDGATQTILSRIHAKAEADVETAYWARGAIVDKNPFSAQSVDLSADLAPFGYIGGYAWSVSSMSRDGQSAMTILLPFFSCIPSLIVSTNCFAVFIELLLCLFDYKDSAKK